MNTMHLHYFITLSPDSTLSMSHRTSYSLLFLYSAHNYLILFMCVYTEGSALGMKLIFPPSTDIECCSPSSSSGTFLTDIVIIQVSFRQSHC